MQKFCRGGAGWGIWIKEGMGGGGGQRCNETQGVLYTLYCAHKCKWGENDKRGG